MKCYYCNKKCLFTFKCSCENEFCMKHRMPEDHKCTYDYKFYNKDKLKINNPKVINDKFEKTIN